MKGQLCIRVTIDCRPSTEYVDQISQNYPGYGAGLPAGTVCSCRTGNPLNRKDGSHQLGLVWAGGPECRSLERSPDQDVSLEGRLKCRPKTPGVDPTRHPSIKVRQKLPSNPHPRCRVAAAGGRILSSEKLAKSGPRSIPGRRRSDLPAPNTGTGAEPGYNEALCIV